MQNDVKPDAVKQSWQTAFLLRTCPNAKLLQAGIIDEKLKRHLEICHVCRDKRSMPVQERTAWSELFTRVSALSHQAKSTPQEGQVWLLSPKAAKWGNDGYFYHPPNVVLLEEDKSGKAFKVAQVYFDKNLMADGDVWLGDSLGFAQGWNCYTLHVKLLETLVGAVPQAQFHELIAASRQPVPAVEKDSVFWFFRQLELAVGAQVSLPSVVALMEEQEAAQEPVSSIFEKLIGSVIATVTGIGELLIPDNYDSAFEYMAMIKTPRIPMAAATGADKRQVNIVRKTDEGVLLDSLVATITDDDWQDDGTYLIAGKLDREYTEELHMLAQLKQEHVIIAECHNRIKSNSIYFNILFKNVPKESAKLDNLTFLLVRP